MNLIWGKRQYSNSWVPPYTCPAHPVSLPTGQTQRNVCSHSFMTALFRLVHTCMYVVCISTYAHRSLSHFIANHALSPVRPSQVSFQRLSDILQAESCLSEVSSIVRPPRRGLPRPNCSSCQPCSNKGMLHPRMYWYVLVWTDHAMVCTSMGQSEKTLQHLPHHQTASCLTCQGPF